MSSSTRKTTRTRFPGTSVCSVTTLTPPAERSTPVDHARDWALGTPEGDWVSMSVCSDGSYGVPEGLISSFPCRAVNGEWEIIQGVEINDFSRGKIDASVAELVEERNAVQELGLI